MDTIDRLVRLLDSAIDRAEHAEGQLGRMAQDAAEAQTSKPDPDKLARDLAQCGNAGMIAAIKLYRQFTGEGLKESKDAIERYWTAPRPGDVK
jgi:ribosomal protein L7/L12